MNPDSTMNPALDAGLQQWLDVTRAGLKAMHAPGDIEDPLRSEFRRHRAGKTQRPSLWWLPPLALAATLAAVSWMVRGPLPTAPGPTARAASDDGPFLALRPLARIALEPGTTVVATEFPRALLADWGLPVAPERAGEPVRAEMLYSADGEPLAVRLLD
jgi:hypothetical protein